MAADWITYLSTKPPMVGVAIHPGHHTHKLIEKYGEFVVSVPDVDLLRDVLIAGRRSGPEKLQKMGITLVPSKDVQTPSITEALANLECRVVEKRRYGDYTFFVGRITAHTQNDDAFKSSVPNLHFKFIAHLAPGTNDFVVFENKTYRPKL